MVKKYIKQIVAKYGMWRVIHTSLAGLISIFIIISLLALAIPIRINPAKFDMPHDDVDMTVKNHLNIETINSLDSNRISKMVRPGLFKPMGGFRDRTMADRTIEKIKSQLKLQCIMQMNDEKMAYININGVGLRKCAAGELVDGMFTVTDIREKEVDITIVGHKVTLRP